MAPLAVEGNAMGCVGSAADGHGLKRFVPVWFFHTLQWCPGISTTDHPGEGGCAQTSLRRRRQACQKPALSCDADVSL
jgi:hypothetical protein